MARLIMWNLMTLDGYVEGPNRDISWHSDVWGEELEKLSIEQCRAAGSPEPSRHQPGITRRCSATPTCPAPSRA